MPGGWVVQLYTDMPRPTAFGHEPNSRIAVLLNHLKAHTCADRLQARRTRNLPGRPVRESNPSEIWVRKSIVAGSSQRVYQARLQEAGMECSEVEHSEH